MNKDKKYSSYHTIRSILVRDYILGFLAFFGFLIALHALTPTLPIYLAKLGSNETEIGALVGIIGISSLVSRLLVGKILLKYTEKLVMMWGAILFALSFIALIILRPFWPFFVVRFVQGVAFACLDTAAIAYCIRITSSEHRTRAISYFLLAPSLASAVAAYSSVAVINMYGFTVLLLACMCLAIISFLLSRTLRGWDVAIPPTACSNGSARLFERKILAPSMLSFMFAFTWGGIMAFFSLYAIQCGVTNPGIYFSANAVMLIAARILGGGILDIYRKEKIIPIFIFVSIVAVVTLAFSKTQSMFIVAGLLWGLGGAFLYPVSMAYALEYANCSDGTAVGTFQAFMDLGLALGPAIMGIIVPYTGYQVMFLCLASVCFMNFCYFLFYLRKQK